MREAGLSGAEERIYGDQAYVSAERQAEARGVEWCVSRKAARGQRLDETDQVFNQVFNQESHRIRARVEPPLGASPCGGTARPGIAG